MILRGKQLCDVVVLALPNDTMKMNIFRLHSPNVKFDDEFKWETEFFEIDNFNLSAKRTV